eukprot:COSAG03_NODE_924_length_5294_cov_5.101636_6_plen_51_part_00
MAGMDSMRRSTVRQKRERLDAAAAGDSTAAVAGGEEVRPTHPTQLSTVSR